MNDIFPIPDPAHFAFLKHLPPHQAIQIWLDGDFRIGEEPALLHAIKSGFSLNISDSALMDIIFDAMEAEETTESLIDKLKQIKNDTEQDAAANP